jgi:hypothetical protein
LLIVCRVQVIDLREQLLLLQVAQLYTVVVMLSYLVNVLVDRLKSLHLLLISGFDLLTFFQVLILEWGLALWMLNLVDQVGEHFVSPHLE